MREREHCYIALNYIYPTKIAALLTHQHTHKHTHMHKYKYYTVGLLMSPIVNNIIQCQEPAGPKWPVTIHHVSHTKYKTDNNHDSRLIY